jgi:hypothetical protein
MPIRRAIVLHAGCPAAERNSENGRKRIRLYYLSKIKVGGLFRCYNQIAVSM